MKGRRLRTITRVCTSCDGTGQEKEREGEFFIYLEEECSTCHGAGTVETIKSQGYRLSEPGPVCLYHESPILQEGVRPW